MLAEECLDASVVSSLLPADRHRGAAGEAQAIAGAAGVDGDLEVIGAAEQRAHFVGAGFGVGGDDASDAVGGGR